MATLENLPAALEPLRVYLKRAAELNRASNLAAFCVRTFAMQIGISLKDRLRPADLQFLLTLMDELEKDRRALAVSSTGEEQEKATRDAAKQQKQRE